MLYTQYTTDRKSWLVLIINTMKIFVGILTKHSVEFVILIVNIVTQYYREKLV